MSERPVPPFDPICCFRCGYALVGIADTQPCPECGLLARHSNCSDDRLAHAPPIWLGKIGRGVNLLLIAGLWPMLLVAVLPPLARWMLNMPLARQNQMVQNFAPMRGRQMMGVAAFVLRNPQLLILLSTLLLIGGAYFISQPQRAPSARNAERNQRRWLVLTSILPMLALLWIVASNRETVFGDPALAPRHWLDYVVACICCAPFPPLLFYRLQGLMQRAERPDLAQHCTIVAITSLLSLLSIAVLSGLKIGAKFLGVASYPLDDSTPANVISLAVIAATMVAYLWGLLILIRFAIALRSIRIAIRSRWRQDDHASTAAVSAAMI